MTIKSLPGGVSDSGLSDNGLHGGEWSLVEASGKQVTAPCDCELWRAAWIRSNALMASASFSLRFLLHLVLGIVRAEHGACNPSGGSPSLRKYSWRRVLEESILCM